MADFICAPFDLLRVWFHLPVDGSPQFRGLEMFFITVELVTLAIFYEWRLLPCVSSRNSQVDATSKALTLILFMFAPTDVALRAFCSCVRSVSSDQGDERKGPRSRRISPTTVSGSSKGKASTPFFFQALSMNFVFRISGAQVAGTRGTA